jgi:hypothetical protein
VVEPSHRLGLPRAIAVLSAFATLALPAVGPAATKPDAHGRMTTSGNDSELVRAVPIADEAYARERVVMSIGPDKLPDLLDGDRLWTSGEVQVSTTCVYRGPRCVGRRYDFNPWIAARLVLAGAPKATAPGLSLSEDVTVHCKQLRPNRNHHCTLVMPNLETAIADASALPCPATDCYVNLVVGAWARRAEPGNRVVVGDDLPDGDVRQDKGRINVVVEPLGRPAPVELASALLVNDALPLAEPKPSKRRVVYSVEIPAARQGDVLAFDASYVATIDHLPFNTYLGSRVIVADTPDSTKSSGIAKAVALLGGSATEHNGFNCTLGKSGYSTPCVVTKAGATRITADAVDDLGQPVPLYLNLIGAAAPKLTESLQADDAVSLSPGEGLRVLRFAEE